MREYNRKALLFEWVFLKRNLSLIKTMAKRFTENVIVRLYIHLRFENRLTAFFAISLLLDYDFVVNWNYGAHAHTLFYLC